MTYPIQMADPDPPFPGSEAIDLYPIQNYSFQNTTVQPEEDSSVADRMRRLQDQFDETGMRRSVEAVILCHDRGVPCVLTFQIANDFFKLPGGYIDPTEDDVSGLIRHLNEVLGSGFDKASTITNLNWNVHSLLAMWFRPNFDGFFYPYRPVHVTVPKERKKIFLVSMPSSHTLAVPVNMKLLAIPIHEFYDNTQRYGPQLSAIPHIVGRFTCTAQY